MHQHELAHVREASVEMGSEPAYQNRGSASVRTVASTLKEF